MCNLYSITTNQAAIAALFRLTNRYEGNLPSMPSVFPDNPAPVVRDAGGARELTMMRWGMPPPPQFGGAPVTNVRNTKSPHWRRWLKPESRCLVPFNSFSEYAPEPDPVTKRKDIVWFALSDDRPLTAFVGIWTEFAGDRGTKAKPIPGPHLVYGFLTTDEERDVWLRSFPTSRIFRAQNGHGITLNSTAHLPDRDQSLWCALPAAIRSHQWCKAWSRHSSS